MLILFIIGLFFVYILAELFVYIAYDSQRDSISRSIIAHANSRRRLPEVRTPPQNDLQQKSSTKTKSD